MKDFLAVSLMDGYVAVAVSLGDRSSSFNLRNGHRLDDGAWHHVEIKRMKKVLDVLKTADSWLGMLTAQDRLLSDVILLA